jgi:hypothetical protein
MDLLGRGHGHGGDDLGHGEVQDHAHIADTFRGESEEPGSTPKKRVWMMVCMV